MNRVPKEGYPVAEKTTYIILKDCNVDVLYSDDLKEAPRTKVEHESKYEWDAVQASQALSAGDPRDNAPIKVAGSRADRYA